MYSRYRAGERFVLLESVTALVSRERRPNPAVVAYMPFGRVPWVSRMIDERQTFNPLSGWLGCVDLPLVVAESAAGST